jgi:UDPglucose 6-dehydrogenase
MTDPSAARPVEAVSVVGLGKLGAPAAACYAHKGYRVVGVDTRAEVVRLIQEGRAPVAEPGLREMVQANRERLRATTDCAAAVLQSDITFIVVPTPSDAAGEFSLRAVLAAAGAIGRGLRGKAGYHLVVLTSTVLPGATEQAVRPLLERESGKGCGTDFGLCYSPEFIALGSVLRDMLNPDFVLIGESDRRAGDLLEAFARTICDNQPAVARMSPINAEIAKLAVNTFVTTKISFANMLARICERLPGSNVDVVTSGLGLDSRIGRKYLKGAIGYGGPCFPRDNVALSYLAQQLGVPATLAEATHRTNREETQRLAALVKSRRPQGGTVAVLGLAYKPDTDVVEESQGLLLAEELAAAGIPTVAYDPAAVASARRAARGPIRFADSLEACIADADVLVVTTPWEVFRVLGPEQLARAGRPRVVIDCWRILDAAGCRAVAEYVAIGIGEPAR